MNRLKLFLVALVLGLLVGFVPIYLNSRGASQQAAATQQRLEADVAALQGRVGLLQLHSQLGMLLREVEQQNFGQAKLRSTRFFDSLSEAASASEGNVREELVAIGMSRDQVTSGIAQADAEVIVKLRDIYVKLAKVAGIA